MFYCSDNEYSRFSVEKNRRKTEISEHCHDFNFINTISLITNMFF